MARLPKPPKIAQGELTPHIPKPKPISQKLRISPALPKVSTKIPGTSPVIRVGPQTHYKPKRGF